VRRVREKSSPNPEAIEHEMKREVGISPGKVFYAYPPKTAP